MATMRALAAVLAMAGMAAVVAMLLVSQTDFRGAVLAQKPKHVVKQHHTPGSNMIHYLKSDEDVSKPLKPRLHALSMQQIMDANSQSVDDLGADFGPVQHLSIGPDGLTDEGSTADMQLLNTLTRSNARDKDVMDAVDASHMVQQNKLLNLGRAKHDMAYEAEQEDQKGLTALGRVEDKQPHFKMVSGDDGEQMSDVRVHHSDFHALDIEKDTDDNDSGSSLAAVDLGEESEAEAMADPMQPMMHPKPQSKGIWIEPGSNKGYDSFALDSLQTKGEA